MRTYVNNKFLVLFITLFCFCEMMQAAKWTDQGKYDISWYNDLSNTFEISTSQQLAGLAYLCNNGKSLSNKTIILMADINLNAYDWDMLTSFDGILDGNGHTISNLHTGSSNSNAFINTLNSSGKIIRLRFSSVQFCRTSENTSINVGGIACYNYGTINNCIVSGQVSAEYNGNSFVSGEYYCGGICSYNSGIIINCFHDGSVTAKANKYGIQSKAYAGGITGYNVGKVINCANKGSVYSQVGYNSSSHGSITIKAYSGGICGISSGDINNVFNLANVTAVVVQLGNLSSTSGYASGITASGSCSNSYYSSGATITAPSIINSGVLISPQQIQNTGYEFTSLLNQNVSSITGYGLSYWANAPSTNSNIPFLLNCFALTMQVDDTRQNTATFTAIPKDIVSSAIVSKGFEYKKDTDSNYKKVNCQDEFTVSVTDLDLSAIYTVRPFVVTVNGKTLYWEETNISTGQIEVETEEATEITANTAVLHGNVQSGAASIKSQGFLWKSENESNFQVVYSEGQDFQYKLEKLTPNTTYTYQAFVLTTDGENIYGNTKTFTTRPITIEISETNLDRNSIYLKGRTSISISTNVTIEYKKSTESNYTKLSVVSNDDGCFECTLSDLLPNTSYDCRVHIVYNNAYVYSQTYTYKTLNVSVQTLNPILNTSVTFRGEVIGGINGKTVGFEYRDANYPDMIESYFVTSTLSGTSFSAITNNVVNGNEYKYRAFYEDSEDRTYGEWITFVPTNVNSGTDPNTTKVTGIALNKTQLSLQVGQKETLTVIVKPDNATDKSVAWTSSNTNVATVSSLGVVEAKAVGNTTITCKANDGSGISATCSVSVTSSGDGGTDITQIANVIYLDAVSASAGSQITLSIKMKNNVAIRGFQFNIYLPQGVYAAKNNKGRILAQLSDNRREADDEHTLTAAEQDDGSILFLCGSQYDETFSGTDGEILTLTVNISEGLGDGDYQIILKNIKLTETDISNYYETEEVKSTLTISSSMPGDINNDGKVDVSDYIGIANRIMGDIPSNFNEQAADVDGNGVIDVSDYIGVANIILTGSIYGNTRALTRVSRHDGIE